MTQSRFRLWPAELFILKLSASLMALDACLILLRGSNIDIASYGAVIGLAVVLFAVGFAYRRTGRSEPIASTAICTGLLVLFTSSMSQFSYLLLPNPRPVIDAWLTAIDGLFGYHWPDALALSARHPLFNEAMRFAYLSTLPQMAILVVVLGLTGRIRTLQALIGSIAISGMLTVMFWGVFPSLGPSTLYAVSPEILATVRPVVDPEYGADITRLLHDGPSHLSPDEIRGLIAFPSYHTVLAATATYYSRKVSWAFPFFLIVNLIVLPAVLVHGGHHLVDIPAGFAVFAVSAFIAHRMVGDNRLPQPALGAR
ncbi:hypothetical protein EET67_19195 [Pseudaminobacter arsenicus]|uniref:Inositolphosphotransferase Aur1/Ipt1 domain-containing protein n=1 Tax=Borborobacter arsenicus TaxID=1851146 RepID=A0A432V237_9HYPH|nr:phosphatase PAP2 family protein [Pseudaminobacter arsenicus]RUM96122.1 hypothetical protein EET67_19195 [Pseudaminobacter arsenicus]